jgi:hypothetical protein
MTPEESMAWLEQWIARPEHRASKAEFIQAEHCFAAIREAITPKQKGKTKKPVPSPPPAPPNEIM